MITLYSTHCPRCIVLEKKLNNKNINFNMVTDIEQMQILGIMQAPVLEVDGLLMNYTQAIEWVNKQ